jgi:heat shock protein HslJ
VRACGWFAAVCIVAVASGCATVTTAGSPPALNGTAWVLSSLPGQTLLPDSTATARFEDGRVSGSDGCNRFTAPYSASGAALQVGQRGASTMMACAPAVMKHAEAFMSALAGARSFRIEGGQLQLLSGSGAVLATLAPQSQSLAGTAWQVTGFNNGRQAVVSVLNGTTLTMAFSADGRASGSAGCNRYTAAYASEGARLTFGPAAATRMMCARPDGVMEQEQQFLKALETVATARFEGDRIELRTAADALAMTLARNTGK